MEQRNARKIQPRIQIWSATSLPGTKHGPLRTSPKVNNDPLFGYLKNEPKPTKVVRSRSSVKQMIACFFGHSGHVATVALKDRRTVNTAWYTIISLPEVINESRRTNRNRRIILHRDNVSCHTARQTVDFLIQ